MVIILQEITYLNIFNVNKSEVICEPNIGGLPVNFHSLIRKLQNIWCYLSGQYQIMNDRNCVVVRVLWDTKCSNIVFLLLFESWQCSIKFWISSSISFTYDSSPILCYGMCFNKRKVFCFLNMYLQ
jgi:hypothetical protein